MAKQTKADVVRALIAANKAKGKDAVVELVVAKKILSKSLASVYVKNNWDSKPKAKKAKAKTQAKVPSKKKTDAAPSTPAAQ